MAKKERILAIDIGATGIRLCEFEMDQNAVIHLMAFVCREYEDELSESTRMAVVAGELRQMLDESGIKTKKAVISLSGQSALIRFGKIPAMKYNKKQISQLAKFEAQRNIPFEIQEVIWDYQLIVEEGNEFIDVMSIVIKNDIVEQMTTATRVVGMDAKLVGVAPISCYNAARANGIGDEECAMIVNIGGRSTNLLFLEKDRFYARSIPIAGYSITQQIAKEFGIALPEAEELKRGHGFVALGGAYAEPQSETTAAISKIIRNVMARLHGEITRSISIYRSQQGGTEPKRMYLAGGSSILTYCDLFFNEKLGIPVEYLNPFPAIEINESVDREALSEVAHMLSEPIGMAFRYFGNCPVEINLLPQSMKRQQALDNKKPYLIFALVVIAITMFAFYNGLTSKSADLNSQVNMLETLRKRVEPNFNKVTAAVATIDEVMERERNIERSLQVRTIWPMIVEEIFRAKPKNVWIESMQPIVGRIKPYNTYSPAISVETEEYNPTDGIELDTNDQTGIPEGLSFTRTGIDGVRLICMTIYEDNEAELLSGPAVKKDFPAIFSVVERSDDDEEVAEDVEEDEEEDEEQEKEAVEEDSGEFSRAYPQYVFVRNLKNSPLFSDDGTLTTITRIEEVPEIPNTQGMAFEVQVKFTYPLAVNLWDGSIDGPAVVTEQTIIED